MSLPFLALAPFVPKIVDIPYEATTLPCVDVTDVSDVSDTTDGEGGDVLI
jgi:hypothetical protein